MSMVKVKTAELAGSALDWAVAQVVQPEGFVLRMNPEYDPPEPVLGIVMDASDLENSWLKTGWSPSTEWIQGGPLMEKYEISVILEEGMGPSSFWAGTKPAPDSMFGFNYKGASESGETILIAVCRAIVADKLGDEVEVPQELISSQG